MGSVENLLKDLRSLVMSVKGGLTVGLLKRDYQEINGSSLARACSNFGYNSVEALIAANPQELKIVSGIVCATLKESSAHVQQLVNQQQGKKFKSSGLRRQFTKPRPISFPHAVPRGRRSPPRYVMPPRFQEKKLSPLLSRKVEVPARMPWPKELFVDEKRPAVSREYGFVKPTLTKQMGPPRANGPPKPQQPTRTHESTTDFSETTEDIFREIPSLDSIEVIPNGRRKPEQVNKKRTVAVCNEGTKTEKIQIKTDAIREVNGEEDAKKDEYTHLTRLCLELGYQKPEFKEFTVNENGKTKWTSMIGGETFRGGVVDSATTARHLAASTALMRLKLRSRDVKPLDSDQKSEENEVVLAKLKEFMSSRTGGVWATHLPDLFAKEFKTALPENWIKLVKNCPEHFVLETVFNLELLRNAETKAPTAPTSTPIKPSDDVLTLGNCFVSPVEPEPEVKTMPEIVLHPDDQLDLNVLSIIRHDTVIARLVDDAFEDMITAMELKLVDKKFKLAKSPVVGNYYAVCCVEMCIRVILKSITSDGNAIVYNIDGGETVEVCLDEIYELDDEFYAFAPQALQFQLDGLMNFPPVDNLLTLMASLQRRPFVGIVRRLLDGTKARAVIELYDTSQDVNVNVNQWLMEEVVKLIPPISMPLDSAQNVILTHVEDSTVYVQCTDDSVDQISSLIEYIAEVYDINELKVKKILWDKTYFAKYPKTDQLQRIRVTGFSEKVEVLFIDHGDSIELDRNDVFDIPSTILHKAPPRACKVAILKVDVFTPRQVNFIKNFLIGKEVIVKTKCVLNIPYVDLFWREAEDELMQSFTRVLSNLPDSTTTVLPELTIPVVNSHMYVTVVLSVNPSSFKVIWKEDLQSFYQLMDDMQSAGLDELPIPDANTLKTGEYLAVKHNDAWYRGKLHTILCDDEMSIQLIDEGNIVFLSRDKLRKLPAQFCKNPVYLREATLHGVRAAMGDWLPSDCVNFQNMLAEKELFATVKDVKFLKDKTPVLALRLIDTTDPDVDVDIHERLISEGIAVADV